MPSFPILLERLSALQRSMMRKFAADNDLQAVHVEILTYLTRCNRYSNTMQALTEYMGQTKGSISQSLAILEKQGLIKRVQDISDRRVFRLHLTAKARHLVEDYEQNYMVDTSGATDADSLLKILRRSQARFGFRGFGICSSCKHYQPSGKDHFVCGITKETLTKAEARKQCREHESA